MATAQSVLSGCNIGQVNFHEIFTRGARRKKILAVCRHKKKKTSWNIASKSEFIKIINNLCCTRAGKSMKVFFFFFCWKLSLICDVKRQLNNPRKVKEKNFQFVNRMKMQMESGKSFMTNHTFIPLSTRPARKSHFVYCQH